MTDLTLDDDNDDEGRMSCTATTIAAGATASDSLSIPIVSNPAMTVDNSSTTSSLEIPGVVIYNYLVRNRGTITITELTFDDDADTLPVGDTVNLMSY